MADPSKKHIVPHKDGWAVKNEGAQRASSIHPTQKQAYDVGRDDLKSRSGGEISIHRENGQIRERNTIPPKKDSYPPKG